MSRTGAWIARTLLVFLGATRALAGTLSVQASLADHAPFAGAVVTVRGEAGHAPAAPISTILDQINLTFVPDIIVVPVGSTVEFPNSDSVSHQIYSFSPAKRFQLPLYHGKPYPPVHFDQAGVVTLGCNIHDRMVGYIVVTDAAYFGRTDAGGNWSVTNVPRGTYHVSLWHPLLRDSVASLEREVSITGDESATSTVQLAQPLRPAPLQATARSKDAY
ncbi:MAG TPA: methylamine utilization protein [Steroidobacteraceae bacterium]|jgi:plastocyanin|nr:methylamine utilization protein [Steroidobacteraceae bacterium]